MKIFVTITLSLLVVLSIADIYVDCYRSNSSSGRTDIITGATQKPEKEREEEHNNKKRFHKIPAPKK